MQNELLEGKVTNTLQEAADKNTEQQNKSALEKKEREKMIKYRVAATVVIIICICLIGYSSTSYEAAYAVGDVIEYFLSVGAMADFLITFFSKKKLYAAVLTFMLIVTLFSNMVAKGELGKQRTESTAIITENKDDSTKGGSIPREQETVWEEEEFDWRMDRFILDISRYCQYTENIWECIETLLTGYAHKYVYDDSMLETYSAEELNGGVYGNYISKAEEYREVYNQSFLIPMKITACQEELKYREMANEVAERYDNLKVMGDIHLSLIDLQMLTDADKVAELKAALTCYIAALPLAYWEEAGKYYYSELWSEVSRVFGKLEDCGVFIDKAHADREELLSDITREFSEKPPMPEKR